VFYLSQSMKDKDRSVRSAVERALTHINSPEAQEILHSYKHTVSIPNYSVSNLRDFDDESDFTIIQS